MNDSRNNFDSEYQKMAFYGLLILTLIVMAIILAPFVSAIMWAIVLSVLMNPVYKRFQKRFSENLSALATVFTTLFFLVLPLALIGTLLFVHALNFISDIEASAPNGQHASIEQMLRAIENSIRPILHKIGVNRDVSQWLAENKSQIIKQGGAILGKGAQSIATTGLTLVIAFLTMFFMLRDSHKLLEPSLELIPLPRDKSLAIIKRMSETIYAVFLGVVLVSVIQGVLAGVGYSILKVPSPAIWAFITFIMCIIPLVGPPIVYVPLGIYLMTQQNLAGGIGLLAFGFLVLSQIDNLLRPFFIGSRTKLHPLAVFFSLLGGVFLFGPVGIMAGPVVLTLLLALQDIIREQRKLQTNEP